jgi:hypothetical protein
MILDALKAVTGRKLKLSPQLEELCHILDLWLAGEIENLMVFAPPQHGKTTLIELVLALLLAQNPRLHCGYCSYGDDMVRRCVRMIRQYLTDNPWFAEKYGLLRLSKATETSLMFDQPNSDGRYNCVGRSFASSWTGHTIDSLAIDDITASGEKLDNPDTRAKIQDYYDTVLDTRMSEHGRKILVSTRWHLDDLPGRLLRRAEDDPETEQWFVVTLAATNDEGQDSFTYDTRVGIKKFFAPYEALNPRLHSRKVLDRKRANNPAEFATLYMCRPSANEDPIFPRENFQLVGNFPVNKVI